jgi:mannose-6-phosphate isomerase-like protein (cupin superfamily)
VVVRKRERDGIQQGAKLKEFASIGYRYEPLAYPMVNKYMEPFIIKVEPQSEEELTFNTHRGEEFVYLMEGNLEFRCADQIVELYEGDSLYFDSGLPHAYRGIDGEAVFLVVIFSPN